MREAIIVACGLLRERWRGWCGEKKKKRKTVVIRQVGEKGSWENMVIWKGGWLHKCRAVDRCLFQLPVTVVKAKQMEEAFQTKPHVNSNDHSHRAVIRDGVLAAHCSPCLHIEEQTKTIVIAPSPNYFHADFDACRFLSLELWHRRALTRAPLFPKAGEMCPVKAQTLTSNRVIVLYFSTGSYQRRRSASRLLGMQLASCPISRETTLVHI